jgi:hypothetical protein
MEDNVNISSSVGITIEDTPSEDVYSIDISPDQFYILQNSSLQYSCYLYKNGEKLNDEFTFIDVSENVPRDNYIIAINDGNHFTIYNYRMYVNSPVVVRCISGQHSQDIEFKLRGLY